MKTVIHAWSHNFNINAEHLNKYNHLNESKFYFGIGDLIRSTIKLFYLSKSMNFNLIVDLQHHPISEFLKVETHEYSDYVKNNKNFINYVCYDAVEQYINDSNTEILLILTNDFYNGEIDIECKNFIKQVLNPNELFQKFINNKLSKIPFQNFNIFHYRLNDNDFLNKSEDIVLEIYLEHFKKNKEHNDILITDTKKLKNYIYLKEGVFMFDTKICHLGLSKNSDEIRDTLFEVFLITYSSKIKTYCKIHAVSGFVKWLAAVYDIEIVQFNY